MALDQKFFKKSTATAATGLADQEQGLTVHIDANDVDSYDGDGSIWYDIANHEVNVPLTNSTNLEVHIDASNINSYPGYGSTITDISTNGYIFRPHGNAAFSTATGDNLTRGYFALDGADDGLRTTDAVTGFSGDLTFEWWFNASESTNFALLHANPASNDSGINGIFIGNAAGSAGAIEIYRKRTDGTLDSGQSGSTGLSGMASDGWVHFVITITSANVCKFYKDGSYKGTITLNGNGTNHDTYNFVSIGGYNNASYEFAGKMGCFRMYSEILTASEIGQNYRAGNFLSYSSIITSKHEATQGTLYTTNLNLNLDANGYSGSGDWQDGANNNDGTIYGATYTNDGNSDYFDFDGSNDYMTVAGSDLNPANIKCFEVWFNTDSTGEQYIISNNNGSGAYGYHLGLFSGGKCFMWIYSQEQAHYYVNSASDSSNTSDITVGEWNHVVWTMGPNAADNKIYLNGNLAYTESSVGGGTFPSTAAHNGISIGKYTSSGWFNGKIAQVRAYSTALTETQINTNYNATKALYQNPDILADFRPSNYSSGTTWNDSSTKSNNATLNNFSSTVADYYDEEIGNFFHLDGSNDYFSTSITKNWASIAWSVEMWFNTDTRNDRYLWGMSDSVGYGVNVSLRGSGNSYNIFLIGVGNLSAGVYEAGRWYHLIYTSDGTTKKAYLNGLFVGSTTTAIDSRANGKPFTFGRYGSVNSGYYDGKLGHTRVYENALTAEQVTQNYLATKSQYPNDNNFTLYSPDFKNSSTPYYFRFNAANDEARISSVDIDVSMGFTVSIYIKRHTSVSGYQQPFRITGTGYPSYLFMIAGHNDAVYYYSDGTGNSFSTYGSSGNWTDNSGAWRNVIFTRENDPAGSTTNRAEVYVNGSSNHSQTNLSAITNITNIYVNRDASYPTSRNAQVDVGLIKIWKKPFSDAEALAEYNATKEIYGL